MPNLSRIAALWLLATMVAGTLSSPVGAKSPAESRTIKEMAARIDQLIDERLQEEQVDPADRSSDAEFLRRVYLDLTGVVPTLTQTRDFLNDQAANKRERLIQRLFRTARYSSHMATVWRLRMLPEQTNPGQFATGVGLQRWLRQQFSTNLRYDNLVANVVASQEPGPTQYFQALEVKPEKLAASTARVFMGLQIQCAECHNHPFDHWTQQDFWGYAAFFAQLQNDGMRPGGANTLADRNTGEVTLPDDDQPVAPKYPGGAVASQDLGGTRRQQLAIWLASRDNPFLARAAVNWAWSHLFGRGLVEPVDDLGEHNPASHPVVMTELCQFFEGHGFDLQVLLETLCNTRAYQRTSRHEGEAPPVELFAKMAVKTMTPEQYYDSLSRCLEQPSAPEQMQNPLTPGANVDQRRLQFITRMQTAARSAMDYENGPRQALQLMNGPLTTEATDISRSALLGALEAPFLTNAQRLESVFLATLTRRPTETEVSQFLPMIDRTQDAAQRQVVLSDLAWAIFNGAEYSLNH